jgi:hypothetical protein
VGACRRSAHQCGWSAEYRATWAGGVLKSGEAGRSADNWGQRVECLPVRAECRAPSLESGGGGVPTTRGGGRSASCAGGVPSALPRVGRGGVHTTGGRRAECLPRGRSAGARLDSRGGGVPTTGARGRSALAARAEFRVPLESGGGGVPTSGTLQRATVCAVPAHTTRCLLALVGAAGAECLQEQFAGGVLRALCGQSA